jgi:hypothetical protein
LLYKVYFSGRPGLPHFRHFCRYQESRAPQSQDHFFSCMASHALSPFSFKNVRLAIEPAWCGTPSSLNSLCRSQGNSPHSMQWPRFLPAAQVRHAVNIEFLMSQAWKICAFNTMAKVPASCANSEIALFRTMIAHGAARAGCPVLQLLRFELLGLLGQMPLVLAASLPAACPAVNPAMGDVCFSGVVRHCGAYWIATINA